MKTSLYNIGGLLIFKNEKVYIIYNKTFSGIISCKGLLKKLNIKNREIYIYYMLQEWYYHLRELNSNNIKILTQGTINNNLNTHEWVYQNLK